jgi:hypothetical protein
MNDTLAGRFTAGLCSAQSGGNERAIRDIGYHSYPVHD